MTKPVALVSNDDGINSAFLHALANAHAEHFDIYVCAPAAEQSWAGRSFSRHGDVSVVKRDDLPWPAWAIDGTPSDAVNIGLSALLPKRPELIVSGINVGFNVTLPLVLTSGTVAAAVEGALWGIRSVAYSQAVAPKYFEEVKRLEGHLDGPVGAARDQAATRAGQISQTIMDQAHSVGTVHNINFPATLDGSTAIERTTLGQMRLGGLFEETDGVYRFRFPKQPERLDGNEQTDMKCLERGHISHTTLDLSAFGRS